MRPTIILLATMALALVVVGGVATGQQQQEQSTSSAQATTTTTDKSSGDVTIQSTTQKASFTNGSGANFLRVALTDSGNLLSFQSPSGQEQTVSLGVQEGYSLCSLDGNTVHGYDQGETELGFGTATFAQPSGAGTFPLTVTRNTTDGKFQLKQVWAKPDVIEKDVTVTMTVKNLSSSTINGVRISRGGDFDVGQASLDRAALTDDSAFLWDDRISGPDTTDSFGMQLTALTFATPHGEDIHTRGDWQTLEAKRCFDFTEITPVANSDLAMRVFYGLGNLSAGQSKSVKFEYGRF